ARSSQSYLSLAVPQVHVEHRSPPDYAFALAGNEQVERLAVVQRLHSQQMKKALIREPLLQCRYVGWLKWRELHVTNPIYISTGVKRIRPDPPSRPPNRSLSTRRACPGWYQSRPCRLQRHRGDCSSAPPGDTARSAAAAPTFGPYSSVLPQAPAPTPDLYNSLLPQAPSPTPGPYSSVLPQAPRLPSPARRPRFRIRPADQGRGRRRYGWRVPPVRCSQQRAEAPPSATPASGLESGTCDGCSYLLSLPPQRHPLKRPCVQRHRVQLLHGEAQLQALSVDMHGHSSRHNVGMRWRVDVLCQVNGQHRSAVHDDITGQRHLLTRLGERHQQPLKLFRRHGCRVVRRS